MDLIRNVGTGKFYPMEGEVYFQMFNKYIALAVEDAAEIEYVHECAKYINSLSPAVIQDLCLASIRYCNDFLEAIGESARVFSSPTDVIALIQPSVLIIPNLENGKEPVLHMELNCDWEIEHRKEWIVRGDSVLYVGAFNGQDPWQAIRIRSAGITRLTIRCRRDGPDGPRPELKRYVSSSTMHRVFE